MDASVTEKLQAEVMDALQRGKPAEAYEKVSKCLNDLENTPLNIAITGESGAGKSTFINAIRGIGDQEPESAQTGVVETTMKPTPYCHPKYKSVKFWDLPGIGSPNFKAPKYLDMVNFMLYDFFVILASERFKENHIMLAEEIHKMNKKFYFVRSKVDRDLYESQLRRPANFNERILLDIIRQDCVENLRVVEATEPRIFLISSFKPMKFDFSLLLRTFEAELPSHKRYIYLRVLPTVSSVAITMKMEALASAIPLAALQTIISSLVPGLVDFSECFWLARHVREYVESFGLDDKSLNILAQRSGKSVDFLKSSMQSQFVKSEITYSLVWDELRSRNSTTYMTVKSIFSWVPVLSLLVAGNMSAQTCTEFLYCALNDIASDARTALNVTFGSLQQ